jgi:predicted ArsR family transcriptional regulator
MNHEPRRPLALSTAESSKTRQAEKTHRARAQQAGRKAQRKAAETLQRVLSILRALYRNYGEEVYRQVLHDALDALAADERQRVNEATRQTNASETAA